MDFEKLPQFNPINPERVSSEAKVSENKIEQVRKGAKESQVAYLERAGKLVTQLIRQSMGKLFDPCRAQENNLPTEALRLIENIIIEAQQDESHTVYPSDNTSTLESIEQSIGYHRAPIKTDPNNSVTFDKTQRGRKFFEIQPGKGAAKRETYWNTLFFPYNTKATRAFAKKFLDDKTIVLLGGGRSRLKEEMEENKISPRQVVNIDPFVENHETGADTLVSMSAADEHFINKIHEHGIESADEIWAEYSVPAYLDDPKEIQQLIQNIDALLAEGGSARIWPIQVKNTGDKADSLKRKTAFMESLRNLNTTNKYEFIFYEAAGRPGFIVHKFHTAKQEQASANKKINQTYEI